MLDFKTLKEKISTGKILVDFFTPSCGPCRMMAPIIDKLATEYSGKIDVVKIDVSEEFEAALEYEINAVPTLALFNNGKLVSKQIGLTSEESLKKLLNSIIGA